MGLKNVVYPLKVISDDEVKKIYCGSLEVLKKTGVYFEDPKMTSLLHEYGCSIDEDKQRVRFPADIVEDAVKKCAREFTVKARNPAYNLQFNSSRVYFASHSAPYLIDPDTGQRRKPSLKDVSDIITIIDALENIDVLLTLTAEVTDKPAEISPEWVFAETFRKTEKTTVGPAFRDCPKWIIKMAQAVGVDIIGVTSCTPPLYYPKRDTDALLTYAQAGYPVTVGSGIAMGGMGPVTLAGSLVQQTAEALAGVVLVQSQYPGTGVLCLTETAPLDMKVGDLAWGSIEVALFHVAQAQVNQYLGLQNFSLFPMSSSLIADEQTGFEKGLQALAMALAGINFMSGGGGVHNESSVCREQLIIDNDLYGMVGRFLERFAVTDETIALDAIHEMGTTRGNYLKHFHTRKWFKQEHFFPHVCNRFPYESWIKNGSKNIVTRARERAAVLINTHQPAPLPDDVERELRAILKAVEQERRNTY